MTAAGSPDVSQLQAKGQEAYAAGDYVSALKMFVEWANIDPQSQKARELIADSLNRLGRKDQSIAMYKKVAEAYMASGSIIKAIAVHKTILALDPNDQEIKAHLLGIFGEKVPEELAPVVKEAKAAGIAPAKPSKPAAPGAPITADDLGLSELEDRPLPKPATAPSAPPASAGNMDELNTVFSDLLGEETALQEFRVQAPAGSTEETFARTPLFSALNRDELGDLIDELRLVNYGAGQSVCKEGDASTVMWVIVQGEAEITTMKKDGTSILLATLTEGDFFGEGGFVTGAARTASVVAKSALKVLEIDKDNFEKAARKHPHIKEVLQAFYHNRTADIAMAKSELFGLLPSFRRAELLQSFSHHTFKSGQTILTPGTAAEQVFLVKSGTVDILLPDPTGDRMLMQLGPGEFFGETPMLLKKTVNFLARARTDVEALGLRRIEIEGILQMFPEANEILNRVTIERSKQLGL